MLISKILEFLNPESLGMLIHPESEYLISKSI